MKRKDVSIIFLIVLLLLGAYLRDVHIHNNEKYCSQKSFNDAKHDVFGNDGGLWDMNSELSSRFKTAYDLYYANCIRTAN